MRVRQRPRVTEQAMRGSALIAQLCLLLHVQATWAQEVFVTRGAGSPVYSDRPQPGAQPLTLPELNVSKPVPVPKAASVADKRTQDEARQPVAVPPAYRQFSVVSPENDGSVWADNALFELRVVVEPGLQLGEGHAITVRINGRPVGQHFTATEFMIPPEFWGDTLPPANQRHQVDAAIVDRDGRVLMRAAPVTFYLRSAGGMYRRPWPRPMPLPMPAQKPKPLPPLPEKDPAVRKFEQQGKHFYDH